MFVSVDSSRLPFILFPAGRLEVKTTGAALTFGLPAHCTASLITARWPMWMPSKKPRCFRLRQQQQRELK